MRSRLGDLEIVETIEAPAMTWAWLSITPFGLPVEPEVYRIAARSFSMRDRVVPGGQEDGRAPRNLRPESTALQGSRRPPGHQELERWHVLQNRAKRAQLAGGSDQPLHLAVARDVPDLLGKEETIDRDEDPRGPGDREDRQSLRDRGVEENADAVSTVEPEASQPLGEAFDTAPYLTVREPTITVDECLLLRKPVGTGSQHMVNQIVHEGSRPTRVPATT